MRGRDPELRAKIADMAVMSFATRPQRYIRLARNEATWVAREKRSIIFLHVCKANRSDT